MTEQERFHFGYVCGDTGLIDEQAEHQWFIENCCSITDLKKNWKTVCNKLNEINEENEELKERVKQLQIDNTVLNKRYWALISENEDLNTSKEYWREKCLSKDSYNKFHHKPQVWFTQELKLTDKQANKVAEAINQSLKERRIKE